MALDRALREYGWVGDLSVRDGVHYPSKAPLLSFAALPAYAALSVLGGGHRYAVDELQLVYLSRLLVTVAPTLLLLVLLRRFLRAHLDARTSDLLVLTYALGTLAFSYSLLFMSHQPSAVLVFAGAYALWRSGREEDARRGARWQLAGGAALAAAVAAEYTAALPVLIICLHAAVLAWRRSGVPGAAKVAGAVAVGALPFVAFLGWYHARCFGHPLASGYQFLADVAYQPWHQGGFLGIRTPEGRALLLSFFSPLRGLFFLSPFLLAALPGLALAIARGGDARAQGWLSAALFAAYAYFTSSFSYESWGWTTGPRHLTALVPFLLLPVGVALERARRRPWLEGALYGLCAASVLATGLVTGVNYIPDSVSSPLFALALPLFADGLWPPTALAALKVAWPEAGLLWVAAVAGFTALLLLRCSDRWAIRLVAAAVCCAAIGGHAAAARGDARDAGARAHLSEVWLTRPLD